MLETELNDTEPSGEERSGARSPEIDTPAGRAPAGPAPAESPPPAGQAGDDQPPPAKGRRRGARRRPSAAAPDTGASAEGAAPAPGAAPGGSPPAEAASAETASQPAAAPPGTDTGGPAAVRFTDPSTGSPAAAGAVPAGTSGPTAERSAVPAATFQPPQAIFQPPAKTEETGDAGGHRRKAAGAAGGGEPSADKQPPEPENGEADGQGRRRRRRGGRSRGHGGDTEAATDGQVDTVNGHDAGDNGRDRTAKADGAGTAEADEAPAGDEDTTRRRRRRRRRSTSPDGEQAGPDESLDAATPARTGRSADEPAGDVKPVRGSTRLEAKRQRRREGRDSGRRRPPVITESELLARREAVDRIMLVRQRGERTQIAVLEDKVLVEHYVDRGSHQSLVGNVYLGKVQNVLPSMEAAFVDIGKGRNAVLYAGEVNFDASGLEGESKRIESALKSGQSILVQVTKDPIGHKGARLTSQVSLPGR